MATDDKQEALLFRKAMAREGVRETHFDLNGDPRQTVRSSPVKLIHPAVPIEALVVPTLDQTDDDNNVQFARSGVSRNTIKQLRRGKVPLQESIDLHGMRSHEAEQALERYVTECQSLNLRAVLIVHGKGFRSERGASVLKPLTMSWLKKQPGVLAFCSALPADGGSGAVYVLLRQHAAGSKQRS